MFEKLMLPASIIIAGALLGAGIYMNGRIENATPSQTPKSSDIKKLVRPVDDTDHVIGNPNSRVLVIEYSDTECPFCKAFHASMNSIMQEYGKDGRVAWVYRHFPVDELHSKARKEAEALECAASQGGNAKFWEYTNKIYEITPSDNGLDPAELLNTARAIGLDAQKFATCLDSGQFAPRVELDVLNAKELGAYGTPYSILIDTKNGDHYVLEGAYPYLQLKAAIDLILES